MQSGRGKPGQSPERKAGQMDIEAQAKEMAERIGWPYAHAAHIRCAGIDDMARAMIAFSDERTKAMKTEIERLRGALRQIDAGIYNDNGTVTTIGDLAIRRIAQDALKS